MHWCTLSCISRPVGVVMTDSGCGAASTINERMIEANPYAAAGYKVLKVETHLHTLHSDGQHSVSAMFEACRSAGYDAVSLTDHNTLSGLDEAKEAAARLGLICVPGVEVTTFHGHAVVLGVSRVPEWRDL